jgi:hypothetical protein
MGDRSPVHAHGGEPARRPTRQARTPGDLPIEAVIGDVAEPTAAPVGSDGDERAARPSRSVTWSIDEPHDGNDPFAS